MVNPFLSGPIALYRNVPIMAQYYEPSQFFISNVSIGLTTLVTTTVNHNYVIGNLCRLIIPFGFGCVQLNEKVGYVVGIPQPNQVVLQLNSQNSNAFTNFSGTTKPQILCIGDVNSGDINADGNMHTGIGIPGAFTNISPN